MKMLCTSQDNKINHIVNRSQRMPWDILTEPPHTIQRR